MRGIVLAFVLAACSDGGSTPVDATPIDVPGDATPRETITETVPLAVTELVEAILHGGPGDYARIRLSAPSLDWNLHGHANGETQVVTEALGVSMVDYLFVPSAEADWYLLLRNRGQTDVDVQLNIELYGAMTWSGWQ